MPLHICASLLPSLVPIASATHTHTRVRLKSTAQHFSEEQIRTHIPQQTYKGIPHIGSTYRIQRRTIPQTNKEKKERETCTKEGGNEQKIGEQRIVGAVSLGVVTGVRAESASDSGAVLHNETQQSLYLGDSSNPSPSLLSFLSSCRSHLIFRFSVALSLPLLLCFSVFDCVACETVELYIHQAIFI